MKTKLPLIISLVVLALVGAGLGIFFGVKNCNNTTETKYEITFVSNGGSKVSPISAHKGDDLTEPKNPTKPYFIFEYWCSDENLTSQYLFLSMPEQNFTLYAKWRPEISTEITFDSVGGTNVAAIKEIEGHDITAPANPTRYGYTFLGWYTSPNYENETKYELTKAPKSDITLYAKWAKNENIAIISYYLNGQLVEQIPSIIGTNVDVDVVNLDSNYTISDWYLDSDYQTAVDDNYFITKDIAVHAVYYTNGLMFVNNVVTGYIGNSSKVVIPAVYNGVMITEIADNCFYNKQIVTEIVLPDTIETIGDNAFYDCLYLQKINLPEALSTLGAFAFYRCERLLTIGSLGEIAAIEESTFTGCLKLKAVTMPNSVTKIDAYAFADCQSLVDLTLSNAIVEIHDYAFSGCKSIKAFNIPKTTKQIGLNAFYGCISIESIEVEYGNNYFNIDDGNLVNYSKNTLILYVKGAKTETEYIVTRFHTIKANAFYGNTNILKLDISNVATVEQGALKGMVSLQELTVNEIGSVSSSQKSHLAYYFGADSGIQNGTSNFYISKQLTKVTITGQLTSIADYAFYGITNLKEVVGINSITTIGAYAFAYTGFTDFNLPTTLEQIGEGAFGNCNALKSFAIDSSNANFTTRNGFLYNKAGRKLILVPTGLQEVTLDTLTTSIAKNAFSNTLVQTIVIPHSVTRIDKGALSNTNLLISLTVPFIGDGQSEEYIQHLFGSTKTVTTKIEDGQPVRSVSFDTINNIPVTLREITITGLITEVPEYAFYGCQTVTTINLPQSVTKIGNYAYALTDVTELNLPVSVREIGNYAFAYCFGLTKIVVPGTITKLGNGLFSYCVYATEVVFEEGITEIPQGCMFPYSESDYEKVYYFSNLAKITIPSTIKTIGAFAFIYAGYYENAYVNLEVIWTNYENSQLELIDEIAFAYTALETIKLPASVKSIGYDAFAVCGKLTKVEIGNKVQGSNLEQFYGIAFENSSKLAEVYIYKHINSAADLPVVIPYITDNGEVYNVFASCPTTLKVYVPNAAIAYYKAAEYWSEYEYQYFAYDAS